MDLFCVTMRAVGEQRGQLGTRAAGMHHHGGSRSQADRVRGRVLCKAGTSACGKVVNPIALHPSSAVQDLDLGRSGETLSGCSTVGQAPMMMSANCSVLQPERQQPPPWSLHLSVPRAI